MSSLRSERRRYLRLEPMGGVECAGGEVRCTGIVDIGMGGMRLSLANVVAPGTRVWLRLRVGSGSEEPVDVVGQVVWARQAPPFHAGVQFLEVDLERLKRLV